MKWCTVLKNMWVFCRKCMFFQRRINENSIESGTFFLAYLFSTCKELQYIIKKNQTGNYLFYQVNILQCWCTMYQINPQEGVSILKMRLFKRKLKWRYILMTEPVIMECRFLDKRLHKNKCVYHLIIILPAIMVFKQVSNYFL